ncbi:protein NRT1/ PTR FAMILY 5.8-like [Andrographis paniculata]|uniref:protein NRT1/ PTR FAMILY 5.8-like n=1 Tax=Andrographis paniculata TaxID=175694 RepID=UPI0021E7851F|nr:protein NRT1/ PTR FAMILY 5.8-like [Andrographis paniculata]
MAALKILNCLNKPCILLIVISGMERFAFKGVASNLVTYLTDVMEMSNSSAAKFVNSWVGFTSMLPLIVATLADTYWDRYSTIVASSLLYAAGLLALTSTAVRWPTDKLGSISFLSWSLYMISLGQGGYNPSLQAFGADQLENEDELSCTNGDDDEKSGKKSMFFQWWYFGVCCGSLLGVSVMSYVQDNLGWGLGFAIPSFAMICSILMFFCGNRLFLHKHGEAKQFADVVQAIKVSVLNIINGRNRSGYAVVELELQQNEEQDEESSSASSLSKAGGGHEEPLHAKKAATIVLRLLPVWIMLLPFAVIFQQPATFFTKQGMTMRRNIGSRFKIPPAALQSSITISIILLMPLYDTVFIPVVRVLTRHEKGISVMQRMGVGMFLSIIAMIIAAITERTRLSQNEATTFSIFWLLPQYVLLGISDIFTVVGMQEFFYSEVPKRMRTMGIALYTSVFGVGSFLSAILITAVEIITSDGGKADSWFSDDMAKARLDKYYWFLALLSSLSMLAYGTFARFFRCRES